MHCCSVPIRGPPNIYVIRGRGLPGCCTFISLTETAIRELWQYRFIEILGTKGPKYKSFIWIRKKINISVSDARFWQSRFRFQA